MGVSPLDPSTLQAGPVISPFIPGDPFLTAVVLGFLGLLVLLLAFLDHRRGAPSRGLNGVIAVIAIVALVLGGSGFLLGGILGLVGSVGDLIAGPSRTV